MSLVSIITPVFNAEKFIRKTIECVLAQTYLQWELILVDDGSTDASAQAIEPYLIDSRIKYLYQDNQGQGKARNTGIQNSTGDFIAFLDADDLWIPEKLDLQMAVFKMQDVDVTYSDAFIIDSEGVLAKQVMETGSIRSGLEAEKESLRKLIRGIIFIPILTVLLKREAITSVEGFDESIDLRNAEDFDLWIRMASQGSKFFFEDRCLSYYRIHENQSTAKDPNSSAQVIRSLLNLRRNHPPLIKEIDLSILDRLIILFRKSGFDIYGKDSFYNSLCEIRTSSIFLNKFIVNYLPIALITYCRFISKIYRVLPDKALQKLKNV